ALALVLPDVEPVHLRVAADREAQDVAHRVVLDPRHHLGRLARDVLDRGQPRDVHHLVGEDLAARDRERQQACGPAPGPCVHVPPPGRDHDTRRRPRRAPRRSRRGPLGNRSVTTSHHRATSPRTTQSVGTTATPRTRQGSGWSEVIAAHRNAVAPRIDSDTRTPCTRWAASSPPSESARTLTWKRPALR